jgi:hypothetical protein
MWHSLLSNKPEHVQAIGMIAIEHTNVEIFLGHMLAHVLNVDAEVGQAIYWKPQSATLRIGILEAAAEQMFRPRYKGSEEIAENRIDADNEAIWNKVRFIVARAKKLTFQRNDRIHTVWGTQGDSQEHVARAPAFTTSSDPSQIKTVPLNELGACPSSGGIFGTNLIPFEA